MSEKLEFETGAIFTPRQGTLGRQLGLLGVSRVNGQGNLLLLHFAGEISDDAMRRIHDVLSAEELSHA